MQADYEALGMSYDRPGVRIERLAEALAVINGAWGMAVASEGEHFTISCYNGVPKPVQRPRPPIVIGGGGERLLKLAGREADIVGINFNLRRSARPTMRQDGTPAETDKKVRLG